MRTTPRPDVAAGAAMALLVAVLTARVISGITLPAPARAVERLQETRAAAGESPREVLLVMPGTISVPASPDERMTLEAGRSLRALLRAYGHDRLPVLLTLDTAGHIVRARSLPPDHAMK